MKQLIRKSKKGNNLEIKIIVPLKTTRFNPYMPDYHPEMDNIVAIIDKKMDECGLAFRIDMDFAGKPDQFTDYFFKYWGDEKEFEKICKDIGIDLIYI